MEKPNAVVSDTDPKQSKRWYQRKNVLIDIAVILAVLLIIGVIWWVGHQPKAEPAPSVAQYTGQALIDEVNIKTSANDFEGAIRLIKGQKSINEPSTQNLLAGAYANKQDYKTAVEIYKKLDEQNKLGAADTGTAADVANLGGDKQAAIAFYKKAIERTKATKPATADDMIAVYQAQITDLEAK